MGGSALYFDIIKGYGENMYIPIEQVYGPSPLPIAVMTPLILYDPYPVFIAGQHNQHWKGPKVVCIG